MQTKPQTKDPKVSTPTAQTQKSDAPKRVLPLDQKALQQVSGGRRAPGYGW